jgi:hypothetical protein
MSISSATAPNPALMALLAQLTGSQSASADSSAFAQPAAPSGGSAAAANNNVTGSGSASLSGEILKLLNQMHQHVGAGGGTSASSTTSSTSASTLTDPLDQLLSTLDASLTASASSSTMVSPLQQLLSSVDDGGDGEFSGAGAANGTSGASNGFAGLHAGGSGQLATADLMQAWENLQNSPSPGSPSQLNAFANPSAGSATSSVSA